MPRGQPKPPLTLSAEQTEQLRAMSASRSLPHGLVTLIHRWLARHPRFHVHFTPTGASWLNLVERWFAALTEKQIRRGVHRSTRELEDAIHRYIKPLTTIPNPSFGPKPPMKFLPASPAFVNELMAQDTSAEYRNAFPRDQNVSLVPRGLNQARRHGR